MNGNQKLTQSLIGLVSGLALYAGVSASASAAPMFDSGIPAGWFCTGNCGASAADGVVTLAPDGGSKYGWVSTAGGVNGAGQLSSIGGTNGSTLTSVLFSAEAGDTLAFAFNYITSDGAGFADYAWARLLDASMNEVALLFTARTKPSGTIVPGDGMPDPEATLEPAMVEIIGGAPSWSVLGGSSDTCYSAGCGYTDWVKSTYEILAAGNYYLQFGVTNWSDEIYDSGMAIDGVTIGGKPITVPEPASLLMVMLGLAGLAGARRRRV